MRNIQGQPFLNLDEYIDVERFSSLHEEICCGIANSYIEWAESGRRLAPQEKVDSVSRHLANTSREHAHAVRGMSTSQLTLFTQLLTRSYAGSKAVFLRFASDDWNSKHEAEKTFVSPNSRNFPGLTQFIRGLPFAEVGRVVFFLLDNDVRTPIHRDIGEDCLVEDGGRGHCNEFIWLRPNTDRQLFMFDPRSGEKIYVDGRAIFFNELDYHGCDAQPFPTYSLRIDGRFSEDFRRQLGLPANPVY